MSIWGTEEVQKLVKSYFPKKLRVRLKIALKFNESKKSKLLLKLKISFKCRKISETQIKMTFNYKHKNNIFREGNTM